MEEQIKTLFEKGYTIDMVCKATGLSKYRVVKIKTAIGMVKKKPSEEITSVPIEVCEKRPKELSEEQKNEVKSLYMNGRGVAYIAKNLKLSPKLTKDFCATLSRPKRGEKDYQFMPAKRV